MPTNVTTAPHLQPPQGDKPLLSGQALAPRGDALGMGLLMKRPAALLPAWLLSLTLLALLLTGCQTAGYYHQAAKGQLQVLTGREPISELLESPDTPEELRHKLSLILEIRAFAETNLSLPVDKQYLSYVDLGRPFAVWNVHAAPEFSLEAKTWWYPIVGRLKYRGYFAEEAARHYAANLASEGFEVYVEGVEAYSTLGWFKDPVMSTFIHRSDVALAEVLFHELAHQRLFIRGDTDLDEAFATAVADEAVRRWLLSRDQTQAYDDYLLAHRRNGQFLELIHRTRAELEALYNSQARRTGQASPATGTQASSHTLPFMEEPPPEESPSSRREAARVRKAEIRRRLHQRYESLKAEWGGYNGYDRWLNQSLNNAQLNTVDSYYRLVPAFQTMLRQVNGDLGRFYQRVEQLADLSKEERHIILNQFLE